MEWPFLRFAILTICLAKIHFGQLHSLLGKWVVLKTGATIHGLTLEKTTSVPILMHCVHGYRNQKKMNSAS